MKLLVVDNYDSFTFNLVHRFRELGLDDVPVVRNDRFELEEVEAYDAVVLSPGPGIPSEAGKMMDLIRRYHETKPMLGICLGHQGICEHFGATLENLKEVEHGKEHSVVLANDRLFEGLPRQVTVGRYHSWTVSKEELPSTLTVIAEDLKEEIMAVRYRSSNVCGLQFHPESVMTPEGLVMLRNWLEEVR